MDMYAEPYIDHHGTIGVTVNLLIRTNPLLASDLIPAAQCFYTSEAGRRVKHNSRAGDEHHSLCSFLTLCLSVCRVSEGNEETRHILGTASTRLEVQKLSCETTIIFSKAALHTNMSRSQERL